MIIKIKNLKLTTNLGIYEWEKTFSREIIINVTIKTNHEKSLQSDNIEDTIDYDQIVNKIKNMIKNNKFNLIEKMAQSLLDSIMEDTRITQCKLEIDKVGAVESVESFSITLKQEQ